MTLNSTFLSSFTLSKRLSIQKDFSMSIKVGCSDDIIKHPEMKQLFILQKHFFNKNYKHMQIASFCATFLWH